MLAGVSTSDFVDLDLDPPLSKTAVLSVTSREESGRSSDAQVATLEDYWHWRPTPARHSLVEIATRLVELRRVFAHSGPGAIAA
jgi:hypothetical protein